MHFDDEIWINFIRGTIDDSSRKAMEEHLHSHCTECTSALADWKLLAETAHADLAYAPPEQLVRMVKQEFSIQKPRTEVPGLIAQIIFDTASQPAVAGVRSAAVTSRQLVFRANEITIDLRFDFDMAPQKNIAVVGQILRGNQGWDARVPVLLFNENGAILAETETTEFGEFQFELDTTEHTRISFELSGTQRVQVPLDDIQGLPK